MRERFLELGRREDARDTEGAWVSTIHGFCARVLRAHAVAAGLDPSFAVLDEPAARALRRRAFETALAAFLGDPEARDDARVAQLELAAAYTPDRLETMIGGVHEELRSRGMTRPALPVPVAADLAAARAELAAAAAAAREELAPARSLTSIDRARAAVDRCLALLAAGGEPPGAAALGELDFRPGQVDELATAACERYRRARDAFARACADARALPVVALLDELLGLYAAAYAEAKRERSAVDFSDLELRARDLFDAAPAVAAGYAEQFRRVMVDEFQDTNPLQLDLIDRLDRDALFVVGDELQSIYGFRHADVRGFQRRRKAHEAAGTAAALATNFRSRAEILHTLNAAFGEAHGPDYVPLVRRARRSARARAARGAAAHRRAGLGRAARRRDCGRRARGPRRGAQPRWPPRRGSSPGACGSSSTRARARPATSSCCCARWRTCPSSSARSSTPASRRCRARAAGGGGGARCSTSAPTSARSRTRATRSPCSACSPRRWSACRPTAWR